MSNNRRVVNGINTIVLHGKDYVEVAERLRIVYELKKELEIVESQPYQFADRWVWRVTAKVDGKQFIGNAEVKLNAPKGTPDGTNPFECAETSALGRALAFAGLGTVESIASYDEITRGQPFIAVVETPQPQIVDASPSTPRLPAPTRSNGQQQGQMSDMATTQKTHRTEAERETEADGRATDQQRAAIANMAKSLGIEVALASDTTFEDARAKIAELQQQIRQRRSAVASK